MKLGTAQNSETYLLPEKLALLLLSSVASSIMLMLGIILLDLAGNKKILDLFIDTAYFRGFTP